MKWNYYIFILILTLLSYFSAQAMELTHDNFSQENVEVVNNGQSSRRILPFDLLLNEIAPHLARIESGNLMELKTFDSFTQTCKKLYALRKNKNFKKLYKEGQQQRLKTIRALFDKVHDKTRISIYIQDPEGFKLRRLPIDQLLLLTVKDKYGSQNVDLIKELLINGAHVNVEDETGSKALVTVAARANVDPLKTMLKHGHDIDLKTK